MNMGGLKSESEMQSWSHPVTFLCGDQRFRRAGPSPSRDGPGRPNSHAFCPFAVWKIHPGQSLPLDFEPSKITGAEAGYFFPPKTGLGSIRGEPGFSLPLQAPLCVGTQRTCRFETGGKAAVGFRLPLAASFEEFSNILFCLPAMSWGLVNNRPAAEERGYLTEANRPRHCHHALSS